MNEGADDRGHPKSRPDGPPRFGFTATKKLGGAVTRNRIRRRLKEAVRLVAPTHAKDGHDYVLIARPAAETHLFTALERDLASALDGLHKPNARSGRAAPRPHLQKMPTSGDA